MGAEGSVRTVGRLYRFRAVHSLPDYPEPWCYPHQHDYTVEVVAKGDTDTLGLDREWASIAVPADLDVRFRPSTVENIASRLLGEFGSEVLSVTVWEDQQRWGRAER